MVDDVVAALFVAVVDDGIVIVAVEVSFDELLAELLLVDSSVVTAVLLAATVWVSTVV